MSEQAPKITWEDYDAWVKNPTNNPTFELIESKLTAEDRLIWAIGHERVPIAEILLRPVREPVEPPQEAQELLRDHVEKVFERLTEEERTVLKARFGLDDGRERTLDEVAEIIGKSRTTAWRVEHQALAKLRLPENKQQLKSYLE